MTSAVLHKINEITVMRLKRNKLYILLPYCVIQFEQPEPNITERNSQSACGSFLPHQEKVGQIICDMLQTALVEPCQVGAHKMSVCQMCEW